MTYPRDVNIGVPDVCAHITSRIKSGQKVILTGYAREILSGVRVGPKHQRFFNPTTDEEEYEVGILANIIEKECKGKTAPRSIKVKPGYTSGVYSSVYQELRELGINNPKWNEDTTKWTCTYFENWILPMLDALGSDVDSADFAKIKDDLMEMSMASGRSKKDPVTANRSVSQYLFRANWILKQMYELNPTLPYRLFDTNGSGILPMTDQIKFIPDHVRVKFAHLLMKMPHYGLAIGAGLMLDAATRTAEACAVKIGEISLRDGYVVVPILYQIKNGKRIPRLKTNAAYRCCIGSSLMYHLATQKIAYLRGLGYTEEEVAEMPLVSSSNGPCQYADPSSLSAFVKELLLLCGFTKEGFRLAASLSKREPDLDSEGVPETDVSAYILRRDWAGRAVHLCGLSPADVDYLLGHKNSAVKEKDYTNRDVQEDLARQLERYVFLPEYSRNPYYCPICLTPGKTTDLTGYSGYCITASDHPIEVTLRITTSECGEQLIFTTDGTMVSPPKPQIGEKDTPKRRENRPMIGPTTSPDKYQEWIEQAEQIDISKWNDKKEV